MTNQEIERKRKSLNEQLKELDIIERTKNIPLQKLAIELHSLRCHSNHTDQCGWGYEISEDGHDWSRSTHIRYYEDAERLAEEFKRYSVNLKDATLILRITNEVR